MRAPRYVTWRLSAKTEAAFQELWHRYLDVAEGSDEQYAIEDDIRALPGHPRNTDGNVLIRRFLTTTTGKPVRDPERQLVTLH